MEIVNNRELRIEQLKLSRWEVNSFIVVCQKTGKSALIDVPPGALTLIKSLEGTALQYILLTHSHIDHIAGLPAFKNRVKAPVAVHAADVGWLESPPDMLLNDGDIISVGEIKIEVIFTPGHTPGSVCFRIGEYLISGDTLFPGGPGRTETPADFQQILKAITEKIFVLPDGTGVYPGHGDSTTIKKEKGEFAVFSSRSHKPDLCGDIVWLTT
jgi:hydroxyacylglutathione hydrolase